MGDSDYSPYTIAQKAGRIINYFSGSDAALSAWELNQLSRPDILDGLWWRYFNQNICVTGSGGAVLGLIPGCGIIVPDLEAVDSYFFVTDQSGTREISGHPLIVSIPDSISISVY
jgi:hypothetical protein